MNPAAVCSSAHLPLHLLFKSLAVRMPGLESRATWAWGEQHWHLVACVPWREGRLAEEARAGGRACDMGHAGPEGWASDWHVTQRCCSPRSTDTVLPRRSASAACKRGLPGGRELVTLPIRCQGRQRQHQACFHDPEACGIQSDVGTQGCQLLGRGVSWGLLPCGQRGETGLDPQSSGEHKPSCLSPMWRARGGGLALMLGPEWKKERGEHRQGVS